MLQQKPIDRMVVLRTTPEPIAETAPAAPARAAATVPAGRDLRLDLFRGMALWLIFLDHIPSNIVSWITIRNYGFSDATEIFVFISGYTAAFVYGRAMRERGVVVAGARILKCSFLSEVCCRFFQSPSGPGTPGTPSQVDLAAPGI